jgi:hypothetical protein
VACHAPPLTKEQGVSVLRTGEPLSALRPTPTRCATYAKNGITNTSGHLVMGLIRRTVPNNGRAILCGTIVVAENPVDSLTASNRPRCRLRRAVDQRIADPVLSHRCPSR